MTPSGHDRPPRPQRISPVPIARLAFVAALVAVLVAALLPTAALPPVHSGWDKADHALAWLALGLLGMIGWPGRAPAVLAGLLVYGGAIELLQGFTGWRHAEWADLLADALGLVAALAVRVGAAIAVRAARRCR